ncbi:hypothetical protein JTB14_037391 [Gonioctena quinquepunctata]|nr:hypothetical protein JTB14_037391 [Gonioctena quinquepunctata]
MKKQANVNERTLAQRFKYLKTKKKSCCSSKKKAARRVGEKCMGRHHHLKAFAPYGMPIDNKLRTVTELFPRGNAYKSAEETVEVTFTLHLGELKAALSKLKPGKAPSMIISQP